MNGILLTSPRSALGSVLASLATDGFRHGVRNHGYGSYNDYAVLLRHNHGAFRIGMKHLPKGNTSSLLCLCGISVSLAFYVLYLKFYPRSYQSVILRRVIRRLIQARSQRQTNSIIVNSSSSIRRRQRAIQQTTATTSFSVCNENYSNDDNNNNDNRTIKISDDDTGLSSIGSIDSSKQDGVIFREFHQTSSSIIPSFSSSTATPAAAATAAAAADQQQRMRHRITRRRRTLSESPPDIISRLDDFICLIPEIVDDRSRHVQPISRTRNVLDWLAQIDLDPTRTSLLDEDPLDDAEDAAARRALMKGMRSLESVASAGSGSSNCGCVYRSRDNWCEDCLLESVGGGGGGGGRSGRRSDSMEAMEVQMEDQGQGLSVLYPRRTSTSSGTLGVGLRHGRDDDWSTSRSSVVPVPALGGTEECGGTEVVVKVSDGGHVAVKKPLFYFEEEEEEDFDSTSEKGGLSQPVHFATSGKRDLPELQLKQGHPLGPTAESPSTDGLPNSGGVAGYDWLRMRILGVDRKRRISTGSGLSAKFLASRGLLRNHHSFTSAISGTSSEYTYRESLVSKGFSIDCGEDLTDFAIQGEDLLEAAEFSRYTLTNIDQLHEELEFIQRNITYINNKVEFLQTRDDLPTFAARYGYGIEESIGNDLCGIMEAAGATFEPGMRPRQRSRSLCLMPGEATTTTTTDVENNTKVSTTFKDVDDDLHPGVTTDGFVWDYGSDLALNPTFTHHRSLNGLAAGEAGEDDLSNQLRTRRSRSDEMEYFSLRRGDLPDDDDDDLRVVIYDDDDDDDVIEDYPEMTYSAQLPVRQHTESTCDEYIDDDYDMLTHLHR